MSQLPSETKIILFYFEGNDFGYDNQSEDKKTIQSFFLIKINFINYGFSTHC